MFRKVLVPLDGCEESEAVLGHLQPKLEPDGEVILLKIVPPSHSRAVAGGYVILGSQLEENQRAEALDYLKNVVREAGGSERWRCEVFVLDSVAQSITEFAHRQGIELIAMYTHDRKGLDRLVNGSVAREVQRIASTEVKVFTPSELAAFPSAEVPAAIITPAEPTTSSYAVRVLRQANVFKGLSEEQLRRLAPLAQQVHLERGQALGGEGELGDHFYVIGEGEAQLGARTEVGDIAARVAGPGDSFPLAVLVGSGNLITSAQAITDMEVFRLGRSDLESLCNQNPEIGMRSTGTWPTCSSAATSTPSGT